MPESTKQPSDNYQVDFTYLVHAPLGGKETA